MRTSNIKQILDGVFAALIGLVIALLPATGIAEDTLEIDLEQALDAPVPPVEINDYFGAAVAICGDTAYVGTPHVVSYPFGTWEKAYGAVFVYDRAVSGDWLLHTTIYPFDLDTWLGNVVDCTNDTVVVSSDDPYPVQGRVSIYERNESGEYNLTYSALGTHSSFGDALAIDGDTLVVGAKFANNGVEEKTGAANVYQRQLNGDWYEVITLPHDPSVLEYNDEFGGAVGLNNDTIAIGAIGDDDTQLQAGAVYVFERDAGGEDYWGQVTKILGPGGYNYCCFGRFLDLDEDTLAVWTQEYYYDGYVHLFERNYGGEGNWGYIDHCGPLDDDELPYKGTTLLTLEGDWLAAGMPRAEPLGLSNEGLVSVFQWSVDANSCTEAARITSPRAASGSGFGHSVDISGDNLIVGEPGYDVVEGNEGAAYFYYRLDGGSADIEVVIADDPDPVDVGSTVDYTITVTNLGPEDAEGVVASFQLSKGVPVTTVRSNDGSCNKRERECVFNVLASGEHVTAVVSAKPRKSGAISLCAEVEAEEPDDPDESNNEACELTAVQ